jgi:3-deoxy-7-phosphoheptulonate synthase
MGHSDYIIPMSRAAAASGADGLMIEVHPNPKKALCDGAQSLTPEQMKQLVDEVKPICRVLNKNLL